MRGTTRRAPWRPLTLVLALAAGLLAPMAVTSPASAAEWAVELTSTRNANATVTLTATANQTLTGTGRTLAIYDRTTGTRLAACTTGCAEGIRVGWTGVPSSSQEALSRTAHDYVAVVGSSSTSYPPAEVLATSPAVTLPVWSVALTSAVADGQVVLAATAGYNLGGSGYALAIWDRTTGTRLASCTTGCAGGTGLTVRTVPRAAGGPAADGAYVATVAASTATTFPPANSAATSEQVTAPAWQVSLTSAVSGDTFTLTAAASYRVTGSGNVLAIHNRATGARMASCTSNCTGGTSVTFTGVPTAATSDGTTAEETYVALVMPGGTPSFPPPQGAAVSEPAAVPGWSVSLAAERLENGSYRLAAAANYNVVRSGFALTLWDLTTGTRLAQCTTSCADGRTLAATTSAGTHTFAAAVGASGTTWPPATVVALSERVTPVGTGPVLPRENAGGCNPAELPGCPDEPADGVDLDTGDRYLTVADLAVPGRGVPLALERTYDSRRAGVAGRLGYGWTDSYDAALTVDTSTKPTAGQVTVRHGNGSQVVFSPDGRGGFTAPSRVLATLTGDAEDGWVYTVRGLRRYDFDGSGRLTAVRDTGGPATTLEYGADGLLSRVTEPSGRSLRFSHDEAGRVTSVEDPLRTVGYGYDAAGNLATVRDADGGSWTLGYDAAHRLTSVTDPLGRTTTTKYDASGRVAERTDARGGVTGYAYGAPAADGAHTTTVTSPNGRKDVHTFLNARELSVVRATGANEETSTTYTYDAATNGVTAEKSGDRTRTRTFDAAGNVLRETDAAGATTSRTYDAAGRVLTETDPLGVTTTRGYDDAGRLTSVSRPLVETGQEARTTYTRAANGDVTEETDPEKAVTRYGYDEHGNRTSVTDATGRRSETAYDTVGRVTHTTTPGGDTTRYADLTAAGEPRRVTDPLGNVTGYDYDALGRRILEEDAEGHRTTTAYDEEGRPLLVTRPDGSTRATSYDAAGNVQSVTDGLGHVTRYGWDLLGRRTSATDAAGGRTDWTYDRDGDLVAEVTPGRSTAYEHDAEGRVTSVAHGTAEAAVRYAYDAAGRRTSMTDTTGTTTYTVDSLGRTTSVTTGAGRNVAYAWCLAGHVEAIRYPDGSIVQRGTDAAGRLTRVKDRLGGETVFGYDDDGAWNRTTYPNGVVGTRQHDDAGRLTRVGYTRSGTGIGTFAYTRDATGRLASATPSTGAPGAAATYGYTANGLLELATGPKGTDRWSYDAADRITTDPRGTGYGYDEVDRLTSTTAAAGARADHGYDADGNRVSTTVAEATTRYGWDAGGRLESWTGPDGVASKLAHDGDGLLVSVAPRGGDAWPIAWDTESEPEPLPLDLGGTSYVYGPEGTPVAQYTGDTATYLLADAHGSTSLLTDAKGAVTGRYAYDPYGASTHTGSASSLLQFAGRLTDDTAGLVLVTPAGRGEDLPPRVYDVRTAQFLSPAPLAPLTGGSRYGYAGGDPLNAR